MATSSQHIMTTTDHGAVANPPRKHRLPTSADRQSWRLRRRGGISGISRNRSISSGEAPSSPPLRTRTARRIHADRSERRAFSMPNCRASSMHAPTRSAPTPRRRRCFHDAEGPYLGQVFPAYVEAHAPPTSPVSGSHRRNSRACCRTARRADRGSISPRSAHELISRWIARDVANACFPEHSSASPLPARASSR